MTTLKSSSEHGTFWRCTLPTGDFLYYDHSTSRQLIAQQDKDSAPTLVKGFAVYDPKTLKVLDVAPTKKDAERLAQSFESSKIVNEQEVQPEPPAPDTPTPEEEPNASADSTDTPTATDQTDKRTGRKPVRGAGSSRT